MNRSKNDLLEIAIKFVNFFLWGQWSFLIFMQNRKSNSKKPLPRESVFFNTITLNSFNSSVLMITGLLDQGKNLSLKYLINAIRASNSSFPPSEYEIINTRLAEIEKEMFSFEELFKKVKQQRDKTIAHIDRKIVNDPDLVFGDKSYTFEDIERLIVCLEGWVYDIYEMLGGSKNHRAEMQMANQIVKIDAIKSYLGLLGQDDY